MLEPGSRKAARHLQLLLEGACRLQPARFVQQQHRRARVLDGVVRRLLDVLPQHVAGQEPQAQLALVRQAVERNRIDDLQQVKGSCSVR